MFPMTRGSKTLIDYLLAFSAALVVASILGAVEPADFTVVNRCDCAPAFQVVNRIPQRSYVEGTKTFFAFRSPRGHTHTCTSCGESWDHDVTKGHKCPFCGGSPPSEVRYDRKGNASVVYLSDPSPKMVKVEQTVQTTTNVQPAYKYDHTPAYSSIYSIPGVSAGNCANGQCSTVQQSMKFRLFR